MSALDIGSAEARREANRRAKRTAKGHEKHCDKYICGGVFRCATCGKLTGWCRGCWDDRPGDCDDCWAEAHKEAG